MLRQPRTRRLNSYWEPIYDPDDRRPFPDHPWDLAVHGAGHCTLSGDDLCKAYEDRRISSTFTSSSYLGCDFYGEFSIPRLVFKQCLFDRCDFGLSSWIGVKFSDCTFTRCSFTQAEFKSCEFLRCHWEDIGISGVEISFEKTLIDNPGQMVKAAYTNLEPSVLTKKGKTRAYQRYRLAGTKSTLARILYGSISFRASDETYYDSIRTYLLASSFSRLHEAWHKIGSTAGPTNWITQTLSICTVLLELLSLYLAGYINGWGRSIGRPLMVGLCIWLFFGVAYIWLGFSQSIVEAFMISFDVSIVAGYTKHAFREIDFWQQVLLAFNLALGVLWYAILIPTLVNRVSRAR